jgi:hypothetical protein
MLTISYNGHNIPLNADFSLRLTWVNPACCFDKIPGDVGVGIDIPVNEYSRTYFGNPHRFEKYSSGSDRKFSGVEIRYSGILLMAGTLNITNATSETYTGWLQSNIGVLGEDQREKFINEITWVDDPETGWKDDVEFVNDTLTDDSTDEYGLPYFVNSFFWEGKGAETTVIIPYINEDGYWIDNEVTMSAMSDSFRKNFSYCVNVPDTGNKVKISGEGCVVSPMLYLRYVIKEMLRMNKFFISRNDMIQSDPDLSVFKNIMVYNNYNIIVPYFETQLTNTFDWDELHHEYLPYEVNEITYISWLLDKLIYKYMLPRISMKDFILSLQNYLNLLFYFKSDMSVDIIDREKILSEGSYDIDSYFTGEWIIGERKDTTIKFISEYDKNDSLFSDEFHDMSERRSDYIDSVDTKAELDALTGMELGDLCLVLHNNTVYEYRWTIGIANDALLHEKQTDVLAWQKVSMGEQPYFYGTGKEEEDITTKACTWQYTSWVEVKQKGNIKSMISLWNDFGLRLAGTPSLLHPAYELYFHGDNGIIQTRWKLWSRFWCNRLPVEVEFDLPMSLIYYISNNITQKYHTRHGEFIIEEMEVEIGLNLIGKTKIRGYKV